MYIVSGGWGDSSSSNLASTETLEKDGGSAWQLVASLPSGRHTVKGVGLDNGRFMVTGEFWTIYCKIINYNVNSDCTAGGWTGSSYTDDVLLYNSEEDEWTTVGHLATARGWHGMSLVPANTVDLCL